MYWRDVDRCGLSRRYRHTVSCWPIDEGKDDAHLQGLAPLPVKIEEAPADCAGFCTGKSASTFALVWLASSA